MGRRAKVSIIPEKKYLKAGKPQKDAKTVHNSSGLAYPSTIIYNSENNNIVSPTINFSPKKRLLSSKYNNGFNEKNESFENNNNIDFTKVSLENDFGNKSNINIIKNNKSKTKIKIKTSTAGGKRILKQAKPIKNDQTKAKQTKKNQIYLQAKRVLSKPKNILKGFVSKKKSASQNKKVKKGTLLSKPYDKELMIQLQNLSISEKNNKNILSMTKIDKTKKVSTKKITLKINNTKINNKETSKKGRKRGIKTRQNTNIQNTENSSEDKKMLDDEVNRIGENIFVTENLEQNLFDLKEIIPEENKTDKPLEQSYQIIKDANNEDKYKCLLCSFVAGTFRSVSMHFRFKHKKFDEKGFLVCTEPKCYFKTSNKNVLSRHILTAHKEEREKKSKYACDKCGKTFLLKKSLFNHEKIKHSTEATFDCPSCDFKTDIKYSLEKHIYRLHVPDDQKELLTCQICKYKTFYKVDLNVHLQRVHYKKRKRKQCDHCDYIGTTTGLYHHKKVYHSLEEYSCEYCEFKTTNKWGFTIHVKRHRDQKTYTCPKCPFTTLHERYIARHLQTHSETYKKCPKCARQVKESYFDEHMRTHRKDRPKKKCEICGAEVFEMYKHMWKHNGGPERKKCQFCSYTCRTTHYLNQHLKKFHASEDQKLSFVCQYCNKELSDKYCLAKHVEHIHENKKPFKCDLCNKVLKSKDYLSSHIKNMHSNKKVLILECTACPDDGKRFKTKYKNALETHILSKHSTEIIEYKCQFCDYTNKMPANLKRHTLKKHNEELSKMKIKPEVVSV